MGTMRALLSLILMVSMRAVDAVKAGKDATGVFHIGMVTNRSGKKKIPYQQAIEIIWKEDVVGSNTTIGDIEVTFKYHHMDGESDFVKLAKIGNAMKEGKYHELAEDATLDDKKNFASEDWMTAEEPPAHPVDAIWLCADSGSTHYFLSGMKQAGATDIPVYSAGSSSNDVWDLFANGTMRFSFVKQPWSPGWNSMAENIARLAELGATTAVVLREPVIDDPFVHGFYKTCLKNFKDNGITVVMEGMVQFANCAVVPPGAETDKCNAEFWAAMDAAFEKGGYPKHSKTYAADIYLGMHSHSYGCPEEMAYLHANEINFGSYLVNFCMSKKKPDKVHPSGKMPSYIYDFSYSGVGINAKMESDANNEGKYALPRRPQMFPAAGAKSAKAWDNFLRAKFTPTVFGSQYDWAMATAYMFWRDFVENDGDPAKMRETFGVRQGPIVSFQGYLGGSPGGVNPYHKYLGVQSSPLGIEIVAPKALSTADPFFPAPMWQDRYCWPKCSACPKCDALILALPTIFGSIIGFFLAIWLWALVRNKVMGQKFPLGDYTLYVGSAAFFLVNTSLDVIAIYLIFLQVEAGVTTFEQAGVLSILYSIFTLTGALMTILRTRISLSIGSAIMNSENERMDNAMVADELAVLLSCLLSDAPILLIQVLLITRTAPTEPLIMSMCATSGSLGFASQAYTKYLMLTEKVQVKRMSASNTQLKKGFALNTLARAVNPFVPVGQVREADITHIDPDEAEGKGN